MNKDKQIKTLLKRNAELSAVNARLTDTISQYDKTSVKHLVTKLQSLEKEYAALIAELKDKIAAIDKISKDMCSTENELSRFRDACNLYKPSLHNGGEIKNAE